MNDQSEQQALETLAQKIGGRQPQAANVDREALQKHSDEMLDAIARGDRDGFQRAKARFENVRNGVPVVDHESQNKRLRRLAEDAGYSAQEINEILAGNDEGGDDDDS